MLRVENVTVRYDLKKGVFSPHRWIYPLENVTLNFPKGKIVGIVGESGSGKSTLARAILRLAPIFHGKILLEDQDITNLSGSDLYPFRKRVQAIFQDPYGSLNPRLSIHDILQEGLTLQNTLSPEEISSKIESILEEVGLSKSILFKYPHEFSGGQRQRVAIARSLILEPEYVICDEILSALDISTQAQVLKLLLDLKEKKNITYIFITHDINLIREIADQIVVFYLGNVVENLSSGSFHQTRHPYTQYLFQSSFSIQDRKKPKNPLPGEIPSMLQKPPGCVFESRCPKRTPVCSVGRPELKREGDSEYRCILESNP